MALHHRVKLSFTAIVVMLIVFVFDFNSYRSYFREVLKSADKIKYEREGVNLWVAKSTIFPNGTTNNVTLLTTKLTTDEHSYGDDIDLPIPNTSLLPVSFGACCGIGHRLSRNIPTMVYASRQNRPIYAQWTDIPWGAIFEDTPQVKSGPRAADHMGNNWPRDWHGNLAPDKVPTGTGTSYDRYHTTMHQMFEMPLAQALVKSMRDSITPLVLSFLSPLRSQYAKPGLHICAHFRQGNNETGDWENKKWRHFDLGSVLNGTLTAMKHFVRVKDANVPEVSVFVASDNPTVRPWFEENAPAGWRVIKPGKEIPRPETGVWFGQHGSKTSAGLNQSKKNEAMAEAVSDVFALGECDALYIPNYSSFTFPSIVLMRMERLPVFFRESTGTIYREVHVSNNRTRPHIAHTSHLKSSGNGTFD